LTAVVAATGVGIVSVAVIAFVLTWMKKQDFVPAEIAIALVVILGALVLVLCVACLSIVLKRLNLTDVRYAMGLPEGSIRAVLALLLVLLFGVVSVFLVGSADRSGSAGRTIDNISQAQADAIPVAEVLSRKETKAGSGRYDVVLTAAPNQAYEDLSKQLLTTLATLVVAIAAFYFGASTVTNAVETAKRVPEPGDGKPAPDGENAPTAGPAAGGTAPPPAEGTEQPIPAAEGTGQPTPPAEGTEQTGASSSDVGGGASPPPTPDRPE
jgi:hypothetical protein